ncbi:MAG: LodA/GoxA family CTQ-dependent oxidase [Microvirga sp.]
MFAKYSAKQMRNPAVVGADNRRSTLDLDPGPRSIEGGAGSPQNFAINRPPLAISTLGELRSDKTGRLLVIGGMGRSGFDPAIPRTDKGLVGEIKDYVNNDSWFDDVADGPVEAEIVVDGAQQRAEGAWVLVGPPDFAPSVRSYRTMYDTHVDLIVREMALPTDDGLFAGPLADIASMNAAWKGHGTIGDFRPSFVRHIYPILSAIAQVGRSYDGPDFNFHHPFLDPAGYGDLGGPSSVEDTRKFIFAVIRDPGTLLKKSNPIEPLMMPAILGDYYGEANGRGGEKDPAYFHSVSQVQYALLRAWSEGKFEADWTGAAPPPSTKITPEGLDRAALENAVGGPFFPGIEAGWLFARKEAFRAPFRVAKGKTVGRAAVPVKPGQPPQKRDIVLEAGAFSQQMAQPWQADFLMCRSEVPFKDGRKIGWWPVQRPEKVFLSATSDKRLTWARHKDGSGFDERYLAMVDEWSTLGFLVGEDDALIEVDGPAPLVG